MFSTINTESCTTVWHSMTHSNQMFTVMDYLLQVRSWQVDLHGALMDGRHQVPRRQKINLKICRMLQNIFCRNMGA